MPSPDILIAGCGPAGLALAAACSRLGLTVHIADPHVERKWTATYGMWNQQWERAKNAFPTLADVPTAVTAQPQLIAQRRGDAPDEFGHVGSDYVVVDSPALQRALQAEIPRLMTSDAAFTTDELRAAAAQGMRVVDCRGAVPTDLRRKNEKTVEQTAFGVVLPADRAERYLPGGRGCLMDWRTAKLDLGDEDRPSFLYAVNLPGERVLLEETDLVGRPALSIAELRKRLHRRLGWWTADADLDGLEQAHGVLDVEKVRFPVVPARRPTGVEAFGTAADAGHPATGYSIAEILRSAPVAAEALVDGRPLPSSTGVGTKGLHRMGLRALLGLDGAALQEMFAGFASMDARRQQAFLERSSGAVSTALAMASQWSQTTNATRAKVARAALFGR